MANSQRSQRHHYLARTSFCKPCFASSFVEIDINPPREDSLGIQYLMEKYINALANDTAEIQEILEQETRKIHRRHISHPDFIPTRIPIFEDRRICSLINDLIPSGNYLDEYTTMVYWNLTVLASHVHVVSSLGNVGPDINLAYIKFSHALCKLKELRAFLGFNRSLYNLCRYNETISLFSRTEKVDYSISVMKYGVDMLRTILSTIKDVAIGETPRSIVCP